MNTILETYFAKHIARNFTIILIVLSSILLLLEFFQMFTLVINKGVSIIQIFQIMLLVLPHVITDLLPFAFLGAIMVTWSFMNDSNEIIIIQSLGISPYKITLVTIKIALLLSIINSIFISYLAPITYSKFRNLSSLIKENFNVNFLDSKKFTKISDHTTIYISSVKNQTFHNIIIYDSSYQHKKYVLHANEGYIDLTSQSGKILLRLKEVNLQIQSTINNEVSYLNFDSFIFPIDLPKFSNNKPKKIAEYTLFELINYYKNINLNSSMTDYDTANTSTTFRKEISYRIFNMLTLPFFAIICAFFFTNYPYSRNNNGGKPIALSIFFAACLKTFNAISVMMIQQVWLYNILLLLPIGIISYLLYTLKSAHN